MFAHSFNLLRKHDSRAVTIINVPSSWFSKGFRSKQNDEWRRLIATFSSSLSPFYSNFNNNQREPQKLISLYVKLATYSHKKVAIFPSSSCENLYIQLRLYHSIHHPPGNVKLLHSEWALNGTNLEFARRVMILDKVFTLLVKIVSAHFFFNTLLPTFHTF